MRARGILAGALATALAVGLLLGPGCASNSKQAVITEMLDCRAANDPFFEESMMMMFPSANNLDEAKEQYIYISQAASMEELEAARDQACNR